MLVARASPHRFLDRSSISVLILQVLIAEAVRLAGFVTKAIVIVTMTPDLRRALHHKGFQFSIHHFLLFYLVEGEAF